MLYFHIRKKKVKVLYRPSLTYLPTYLSSLPNGDQGQVLGIGIFGIFFYFFLYPFTGYQLDPSPHSYTLSSFWFPKLIPKCVNGLRNRKERFND